MNRISDEDVARLLKPVWIDEGEIAPAAFTLRPNVHETYISVLRESMPTFRQDAFDVTRKKNVYLASLSAKELSAKTDTIQKETITYEVFATDNDRLKSHAGIFIAVNGHNIVGGEPFQKYMRQRGVAEEILLIDISEKLARMAKIVKIKI